MSTDGYFLGYKMAEALSFYSPVSDADVNNVWSFTSIPPIGFYAIMLTHRNDFIFF
jgi:hypothetical protein